MPVTPVAATASPKPGSLDQSSQPITLKRGSRVWRSMRTRSMAPGAARWPPLIWAPSKAGPVGLDAASSRSRLPSRISALVPTSTMRLTSGRLCGASASSTPAASAPTWPAMQGRAYTPAPGLMARPKSAAEARTGPSTAKAKGAPPSSTGLKPRNRWCMMGLAATVRASTASALMPASATRSASRPFTASRTAAVNSASPPGCIITQDTRLIRSSPKRICGFMRPAPASTSPVARSQRCADKVVEPMSSATPEMRS